MSSQKTIILTAYDVDPFKGGESAVGWNVALQGAREFNVILITRENNRTNIESYVGRESCPKNLQFEYFDLPYYLRFWKRGVRGSSVYFYLWQMFVPFAIWHRKYAFDVSHSVNFVSDNFPTFLWMLKKPVIWGPVSHHEKIGRSFVEFYGIAAYVWDRFTWLIKLVFWNFDPFHYMAKRKSFKILAGNQSVPVRLNIDECNYVKFSSSAIVGLPAESNRLQSDDFNILVVSRLAPVKSVDVCILAFEKFVIDNPSVSATLNIVGSGPYSDMLKRLAEQTICYEKIVFHGNVLFEDLESHYNEASTYFTASHEGGGMSVVEALSHGLPVICFDNFGPGESVDDSCGLRIKVDGRKHAITNFAGCLSAIYLDDNLRKHMSGNARKRVKDNFLWSHRGDTLKEIYEQAIECHYS
jgi:glycosyltransferase involved in cell wall biosynthesis